MVFHWSLSDSKSPQVSRTRLRILAILSNAVVWTVFTRPQISKSSRRFNNPLVIVPNAPITIGKIVTFMFHSFFNSLARSRYLSFFSLSFKLILWSAGIIIIIIIIITIARSLDRFICLDYVLITTIDKIYEHGFKVTKERSRRYPAKTITDTDYADAIALLANAPAQAETLLPSLERAAAGIGLHVNAH